MNKHERNKRLGQYFTSLEVAKLLTELALKTGSNISEAIDPMMGEGVFISAIDELKPSVKTHGIELDTSLADYIDNKFNNDSNLLFGSAFNSNIIKQFQKHQFDLVITNPPYVRHLNQIEETTLKNGVKVPSGIQVRMKLLESIKLNPELSFDEREFLIESTKKYSGLSDLSVPSIIQCASLTRKKGVIALLIPEPCITREYSISTLNVLFKLFNIKLIVKDEGRNWFNDVQVKTLLVVGEKLENPRDCVLSHSKIPVIEIFDSTPEKPLGEKNKDISIEAFASHALDKSSLNSLVGTKYFRTVQSFVSPVLTNNNINSYPEFNELFLNKNQFEVLDTRLTDLADCTEYFQLNSMSLNVHQGLRTGANRFFYCDLIKEGINSSLVSFKINNLMKEVQVPNYALKPVLRKQNEIKGQNKIYRKNLKGRLIDLNNSFTPSDIARFNLLENIVRKLPKEISDHIEYCSKVNIGSFETPNFFPQLSAVKTNISTTMGKIRTWYQIPELKDRHIPDICIPRVNSGAVKPLVVEKGVVVDANFITINITADSIFNKYGTVALLSSDWVKVQLELNGNTLGGGALKLDRSHILNLMFPTELISLKNRVEKLGKKLVYSQKDEEVILKINEMVNSALGIKNNTHLINMLNNRLNLRK